MWWMDHCLTYTFKSTTRYVDPTIWAQPELPHEQVIRAHGYPKIPVISRTSSCFSVSQRLSRWELDAICHLFELRTLGVYLWGADDLNMLDWQIDHVEISLDLNDLAFQADVKGMRWKDKGLASICDTCCWLLIWFSGSSCPLTRVECFRHFSWHRRRSCSPRTCSSPSPMLLNYSSQFLCFEHRIPHSHSIDT